MTIFPLLVNPTDAATPDLPALADTPDYIQDAHRFLTPYEKNLSSEDLLRCIAKIYSIADSIYSEMPPKAYFYFPSEHFDTIRNFSLITTDVKKLFILMHFDKRTDGFTLKYKTVTISPAIDITTGNRVACITPSEKSPFAKSHFASQFPFLKMFRGRHPGIIPSICIDEMASQHLDVPTIIQPYPECSLSEYLTERGRADVAQFISKVRHLSREEIARDLMSSLLQGLVAIHERGFIHNNVSPKSALLFLSARMRVEAKLIDFRSSTTVTDGAALSEPYGRYGFIPPDYYYHARDIINEDDKAIPVTFKESFEGHTQGSDIWALGHVFFQILFHNGIDPKSKIFQQMVKYVPRRRLPSLLLRIHLQKGIMELVAEMLHPNPTYRPTARDTLKRLNEILTGE